VSVKRRLEALERDEAEASADGAPPEASKADALAAAFESYRALVQSGAPVDRWELLKQRVVHYWPRTAETFLRYPQQTEIVRSVVENVETFVVAGNQLGKDWAAGLTCTLFFLEPWLFMEPSHFRAIEATRLPGEALWQVHTRRIVTTSVDGDQLRNLWGEIGRLLLTSAVPLHERAGGPLVLNQRDISLVVERGLAREPLNYLIGRVTGTGEGISGAHAAYTLMCCDEASAADNAIYRFAQGWVKRFLFIGNANPVLPSQFFRQAIMGGDIAADD